MTLKQSQKECDRTLAEFIALRTILADSPRSFDHHRSFAFGRLTALFSIYFEDTFYDTRQEAFGIYADFRKEAVKL